MTAPDKISTILDEAKSKFKLAQWKYFYSRSDNSFILEIIGLAACGIGSFIAGSNLFQTLWRYALHPSPRLKDMYGGDNKCSPWCLVTGGSAGIGYEIAKLYASQGFNIILLARNEQNLSNAANAIRFSFPNVMVKIISMDANKPDYLKLMENVEDNRITVLVNNVAHHNSLPGCVHESSLVELQTIISINCLFTTQLTSLLIPHMHRSVQYFNKIAPRAKPCRGLVMNISSLTSTMDMPLLSTYAATKAYLDRWSQGIAAELLYYNISEEHDTNASAEEEGGSPRSTGSMSPKRPTTNSAPGFFSPRNNAKPAATATASTSATPTIDVINLRPGLTVSAMSGIKTPSFFVPTAESMARWCVYMVNSNASLTRLIFSALLPSSLFQYLQSNLEFLRCPEDVTIVPYFPHKMLEIIDGWVPNWVKWPLVYQMHQEKRLTMLSEKAKQA